MKKFLKEYGDAICKKKTTTRNELRNCVNRVFKKNHNHTHSRDGFLVIYERYVEYEPSKNEAKSVEVLYLRIRSDGSDD